MEQSLRLTRGNTVVAQTLVSEIADTGVFHAVVAVETPIRNFVIRSPAGSDKTYRETSHTNQVPCCPARTAVTWA